MRKIIQLGIIATCIMFFTANAISAFIPITTETFSGEADTTRLPIFSFYTTKTFGGKAVTTEIYVPINFTLMDTQSFGGKYIGSVGTIETDVHPDTWDASNPNCGDQVQNNFTFYQNGTATLTVKIGFNTTNYTFVNYATWYSNGHDQYCANFTIDSWSSETNIAPKAGGLAVTVLKTGVTPDSSFGFGVRIWMPKTVSFANLREDFNILLNSTVT